MIKPMENFKAEILPPKIKISNKSKISWLNSEIGKIFKVLPLIEMQGVETTKFYLTSLIYEFSSGNDLYFDGEMVDIIPKLNVIIKESLTHSEIRKIVLECTNLVNKYKEKWQEEDDG